MIICNDSFNYLTVESNTDMSVSYVKLWKLLIGRGLKRTDLISMAGISTNILAKLGKNDFVSMESLEKICKSLNCNIGDIVDFTFNENMFKE